MTTKNDRHVKKRSSENFSYYIICLAVASSRNSCISFRKTKTLFSTFSLISKHAGVECVRFNEIHCLNYVVQNTFQLIRYGFYCQCLTMNSAVCTNRSWGFFLHQTGTATKHRWSTVGTHAKSCSHLIPCASENLSTLSNISLAVVWMLFPYYVHNIERR